MTLVALLIALNGLFVAGEFSLLAVDPARVDAAAASGRRRARSVEALRRRLTFHLGGAQLGITVSSLLLGVVAEDTVGSLLSGIGGPLSSGSAGLGVAAIAVAAGAQMTLGELAPKNLAVSRPLSTAMTLAPVLRLYGVIVAPVVLAFNGIANLVVRALGLRPTEELRVVRTLEELEQVLRESRARTLDRESAQLLGRMLRLAGKVAADALTPRTSLHTLDADATVADLADAAAATGFSRYPVVGDDVDDVVGVVDVRDVLAAAGAADWSAADWSAAPLAPLVRPVLVVGEQLALDRVLAALAEDGSRLAVVVDEYGGTAGVITSEDVVEEVVGNLEDEHDARHTAAPRPRRAAAGGARTLSGKLTLDEASEILEEMAAAALAGPAASAAPPPADP
ncbi:MAG TPA: hypothetical protein DEP69_01545, partial [Acidimicrobiaceae bacterium]|nr:hypothetical protein [Acidimicrobiaceae bacterium]